jgi:hypothetical protein
MVFIGDAKAILALALDEEKERRPSWKKRRA